MRNIRQFALAILVFALCLSRACPAVTRPAAASGATPGLVGIQVLPESTFLELDSTDGASTLRQTRTQVRIAVTGSTLGSSHPIEVYACVNTDVALRLSGKPQALPAANLKIRNDRGEWAELEPLPNLEGRRGVRIAVFNGASTTIPLQVQLEVPTGQVPGRYQGVLTIQAVQQ